jgi:hypothetical protein
MSNISANNWAKTALYLPPDINLNNIEIQTRISTSSYGTGFPIHYHTGSGGASAGLRIYTSGKFYWQIGYNDTTSSNIGVGGSGPTVIPLNTLYYVKMTIADNTATLSSSSDGVTWTTEGTLDVTSAVIKPYYARPVGIGHAPLSSNTGYVFDTGTIDIKNTYIKINGEYWFRGDM